MNIPETGGILNIGALLNASADEIDVAANLADLTAKMVDDDGDPISVLEIDSIFDDDSQCQITVTPIPIVGQIATTDWQNDYETRTTFNVEDSTIFEVGDTLEVVDGATPEEMTITDVGVGEITVERGTPADAIGDATYLKILNRDNGIPVGTYTLVLGSPVGTIVTRNISVDVLSDEAFDTYYSATLLTGIKTKTDALKGGIRDRFNT